MSDRLMGVYPVAIVQDRYGGAFTGGRWIAFAEFDAGGDAEEMRRVREAVNLIHGGDWESNEWWEEHKDEKWVGVGATPDLALANLLAKQDGAA